MMINERRQCNGAATIAIISRHRRRRFGRSISGLLCSVAFSSVQLSSAQLNTAQLSSAPHSARLVRSAPSAAAAANLIATPPEHVSGANATNRR